MINATKNIFDDFAIVSLETECKAAFNELAKSSAPIAVVTDDELTFIFHFSRFHNDLLLMKPLESPRELKLNENAFIIFSISTGQYALKAPLQLTREGIVGVDTKTELRRLQRRKDFRIQTFNTRTLLVELTVALQKPFKVDIIEISAGGIAVIFPLQENFEMKVGQELRCRLVHPKREIDGLEAIVRHVDPVTKGLRLGIQFLNLSIEQRPAMLALSLQMHRENTPVIKK